MAAITDPVNKQNIVDRFADYVTANANSGISWGTNAYPFGEWDKAYLFGGSTGGKAIGISGGNISGGASGEVVAQYIYDALITETYYYTSIRNMRALLNVTGGGGNTGSRPTAGIVYDGTAVTFMNGNYYQGVSAGRDNVYAGNTITASGLQNMFYSMYANYWAARGNTAGPFQTDVCHASCHSSCHSSRGRR